MRHIYNTCLGYIVLSVNLNLLSMYFTTFYPHQLWILCLSADLKMAISEGGYLLNVWMVPWILIPVFYIRFFGLVKSKENKVEKVFKK